MQTVMSDESLDLNIIDFFDSLNFYVSEAFTEKWKYKYSELLIGAFKDLIIASLKKSRPVKYNSALTRLKKKTGLSEEVIEQFLSETGAATELFPIILPQ